MEVEVNSLMLNDAAFEAIKSANYGTAVSFTYATLKARDLMRYVLEDGKILRVEPSSRINSLSPPQFYIGESVRVMQRNPASKIYEELKEETKAKDLAIAINAISIAIDSISKGTSKA